MPVTGPVCKGVEGGTVRAPSVSSCDHLQPGGAKEWGAGCDSEKAAVGMGIWQEVWAPRMTTVVCRELTQSWRRLMPDLIFPCPGISCQCLPGARGKQLGDGPGQFSAQSGLAEGIWRGQWSRHNLVCEHGESTSSQYLWVCLGLWTPPVYLYCLLRTSWFSAGHTWLR